MANVLRLHCLYFDETNPASRPAGLDLVSFVGILQRMLTSSRDWVWEPAAAACVASPDAVELRIGLG